MEIERWARWTPQEERWLLENYMNYPVRELAERLNKTKHSIMSKKKKLINDGTEIGGKSRNLRSCPLCNSHRFNEVDTYYMNGSVAKGYYCMSCDKQFDHKGQELRQII